MSEYGYGTSEVVLGADEVVVPLPPEGAPVAGEIWRNARSGIEVEVRNVRFAENIWQVDIQTHGVSVRMGYSLSDFLALHVRPDVETA